MTGECTGYHWTHGQFERFNCSQESSTFFMIVGFTMLVLLILLGLVLVIACLRKQRRMNAAASSGQSGSPGSTENCVIEVDGNGTGAGHLHGKNLESVKCVIMAGEDKPTFLAHRVAMFHTKAKDVEQGEQGIGETSKQQQIEAV